MLDSEVRQLRALRADNGRYRQALSETGDELAALRSAREGLKAGDDPALTIKTLQQRLDPREQTATRDWRTLRIADCENR